MQLGIPIDDGTGVCQKMKKTEIDPMFIEDL